ncbi:choice-of-anchor P family protein [Thermomonospora cellulosilytica]|uniref:Secreted protein n=1 Tax=Thermomonospora cellulosilytica TaxID=1411118 RepID=A0A7W3R7V7_9ACTN|nr:choice-of-anchor P family protein [Thermomonospora cellulosilytica]MBA9002939.1 hypothetical protein [Thermomonospora cellulosilytica]
MRLSSTARTAAIAGVLVAPVVIAGAPAAFADKTGAKNHGSAYGLTADGLVTLPATPQVAATGKTPQRKSVADLPPNSLVNASGLNASAQRDSGRASVSDLNVAQRLLQAETVSASCNARKGNATLGNAYLNGRRLAANPKPNSKLQVPIDGVGEASVVLNSQRRNPQGGLTVTAIELNLPSANGKPQRLGIASATCGAAKRIGHQVPKAPKAPESRPEQGHHTGGNKGQSGLNRPAVVAPAPTPVTKDLAVTG